VKLVSDANSYLFALNIFIVDLFASRITTAMFHFQYTGNTQDHVWSTSMYPMNMLNSTGVTLAYIIDCAQLCLRYLYCSSFSYNKNTQECRFVVAVTATNNYTLLTVYFVFINICKVYFQAQSAFNTYDIVV
jgi:hypothetical protein